MYDDFTDQEIPVMIWEMGFHSTYKVLLEKILHFWKPDVLTLIHSVHLEKSHRQTTRHKARTSFTEVCVSKPSKKDMWLCERNNMIQ